MTEIVDKRRPRKRISLSDVLMKLGPLLALFILGIAMGIATPKFVNYYNFMNILKQTSINFMISAGMLVVLITAGIDLSVGSTTALATCIMGVLVKSGVHNVCILIVSAMAVAIAVGYINGILLTKLHLPHPFVSTLGTRSIVLGVALLITDATPIGFINKDVDSLLLLGSKTIFGFPISFIAVIIVVVIYHIFLNKTMLGRQLYCVGGNPEAARLSGINSDKVLTIAYTISGAMTGIAGIIMAGRVSTASATAGATFDMDSIASCIIGGASFMGGKGTIFGVLIGSLLISTIRNGLNLLGAQNDIQYIVIGAVIIVAVLIDVTRGQMEQRARRIAQEKVIEER
ncbi:ABC transporter permease [Sediminispirochaeta smaragdinae]|uniref:Inner-membrane translocator n=1 Tax=Sediminispirochaeta smaragdinae (strain DSM 11293 / JCM 15392 / SEBR 4228) TaxID=573413 RepID=E1R4P2_SEDSS|nr:ABC transporter permease [Sediminispirochaeta smaragdinae]ADK82130.1 inner-membrane translocator [Sediminispirochaeta smaragdinae DSM 11293]